MLSKEKNMKLTQVGPGTPGGELLRRYWHPVCPAIELTSEKPKKRIRILSEDLVVYMSENGEYHCINELCPHRGCSLYYGFVEEDGIRCAYHGWKYDKEGFCVDQPLEKKKIYTDTSLLKTYEIQKFAGLLYVYMGPKPAPLIPRFAPLVKTDGARAIEVQPVLSCNWLQIQENTLDSAHTYYLHGHVMHVSDKKGAEFYYRNIADYDWKYCEWGIEKKVIYGGDKPGTEIRPPAIFPNILLIDVPMPDKTIWETIHYRVPVDETHTRILVVLYQPGKPASEDELDNPPVSYISEEGNFTANGEYDMTPESNSLQAFYNQDRMAWETPGTIYDRSIEHLGATDRGIVMFRRQLEEQIDIVQSGGEPMAVVRDPKKNEILQFESVLPL